MKFNKLYLHGFKSFVDKTVVDFPAGITAIVGPNGSGKSNIMDAVRWVFGEQNAKELRGAEMDDVVFNGSQKRKPAGFAEVGLTLSDIDEAVASKYGTFSEITVSRKFYKTGEREYYINNRKCRLKDIKDIFMDTGLGARSISIIEQGKVDKVINASPEELRFFLEEAAGVTRFKDKKKNAERRLAQTRDNLDRVNDIITEIVSRREALAAQVEVLQESRSLQSRRRELEKKLLCHSYLLRSNESDRLSSELAELKKDLEAKIAEYTEHLNKEREIDALYSQKQSENTSLQERRLEGAKDVTKTEGVIASLKERLSSSKSVKAQIKDDIYQADNQLAEALSAAEKINDNLEACQDSLSDINDKIESLRDIIDDIIASKEACQDELAEAEAEYLEHTSAVTHKRNSLIRKETELEHSKTTIERLESERLSLNESAAASLELRQSVQEETEALSMMLSEAEIFCQNAKAEADKAKADFDEIRIKSVALEASLKGVESNLSFLNKELEISSKDLGDDSHIFKTFKPTLLIDKLQDFPKNFLAEVGDVILFEDSVRDDVIAAVAGMKSSLKFTFESMVPLIREQLSLCSSEEAVLGIYLSDGIYRKVGDEDRGLKIVRLKERIEEENAKYTAAKKDIADIKDRSEQLSDIFKEKSQVLDFALSDSKEKREQFSLLERRLDALVTDIEINEKRLATIHKEIALANLTIEENNSSVALLKNEIKLLGEKQLASEENRQAVQDKLDYITDDLEGKKDEMRELKIFYSSKEGQAAAFKKELEANNRLCAEISARIDSLKKRLDQLENRDEVAWIKEIETFENLLTEGKKILLSLEEALEESFKELDRIKTMTDDIKQMVDKSNSLIKAVEEQTKSKELAIASAVSFLDAVREQYAEKFATDVSLDYKTMTEQGFQPKKAKDEIYSIEKRLDELGPINLNAENDYSEIEERYTFLAGQRKDLEESVNDIVSFITETDEATAALFGATFNSVRDKFIEVFHILFGNGEADLRLTEPDNMLISGVEIYIQPPGKKLQHMGLLSGGEKALAAMTLLFGLFLHKPTPFCFLDEVDAPLDDANVDRYISMVKALSEKTQFILITHNHNTMSVADSLYGVTMQEYGVSKILSVKLEQAVKAGR